jgi:hypothetical protein
MAIERLVDAVARGIARVAQDKSKEAAKVLRSNAERVNDSDIDVPQVIGEVDALVAEQDKILADATEYKAQHAALQQELEEDYGEGSGDIPVPDAIHFLFQGLTRDEQELLLNKIDPYRRYTQKGIVDKYETYSEAPAYLKPPQRDTIPVVIPFGDEHVRVRIDRSDREYQDDALTEEALHVLLAGIRIVHGKYRPLMSLEDAYLEVTSGSPERRYASDVETLLECAKVGQKVVLTHLEALSDTRKQFLPVKYPYLKKIHDPNTYSFMSKLNGIRPLWGRSLYEILTTSDPTSLVIDKK